MIASGGVVIVVDDDKAVLASMRFVLELEGLDVRLYGGGAELLEIGDLPESGCLVVDQYMPGIAGLDLVARLRDRRVLLPAILITAESTEELRRRAGEAGIDLVVEKPFDDSSLMDGIHRALAIRPSAAADN